MDTAQLHQEIDDLFENVNLSMSTYRPESELSQLNRTPVNQWQIISAGFFNVLKFGQDLCRLSDGAFDVTVGELVNLWGFGPVEREGIPTREEVVRLQQPMGCDAYQLDAEDSRVMKLKPAYIDLSAIAKGYGVDIVSNYLILSGVDDFMVELGGEIKTSGRKPDGANWRVAIGVSR